MTLHFDIEVEWTWSSHKVTAVKANSSSSHFPPKYSVDQDEIYEAAKTFWYVEAHA